MGTDMKGHLKLPCQGISRILLIISFQNSTSSERPWCMSRTLSHKFRFFIYAVLCSSQRTLAVRPVLPNISFTIDTADPVDHNFYTIIFLPIGLAHWALIIPTSQTRGDHKVRFNFIRNWTFNKCSKIIICMGIGINWLDKQNLYQHRYVILFD